VRLSVLVSAELLKNGSVTFCIKYFWDHCNESSS
jgi:hypothetical protein